MAKNIGQKVEWLFKNILKADGSQYTHQDVEEGTAKLGYKVTATAIWKIRNNKTRNPGYLTLRALGQYFNVPTTYFYEDELSAKQISQINNQTMLSDPKVHEIALRASKLDSERKDVLLNLMKYLEMKG